MSGQTGTLTWHVRLGVFNLIFSTREVTFSLFFPKSPSQVLNYQILDYLSRTTVFVPDRPTVRPTSTKLSSSGCMQINILGTFNRCRIRLHQVDDSCDSRLPSDRE